LNVVPIESHYFEHSGYRVSYPLRFQEGEKHRGDENFLHSALNGLKGYEAASEEGGDLQAPVSFDLDAFRSGMEGNLEKDGPDRMDRYFRSLMKASGLPVDQNGIWVEKSVEHFEFILLLKRWFPDARFVHILRDPYANLVSLRKFRTRSGVYPFLPPLIESLRWHRHHWLRAKEAIEGHFTVHFEKLLREPENTMRSLAQKLELPFDPILLKPSSLGREWKGNRITGEEVDGFATERAEDWKEEIFPHEIFLLNHGLKDLIELSGYERIRFAGGFLKRAKGEAFKTYISNRLFKNYN
jgi:hypothetical protein